MNPGRELDALIAEKVMGWKNHGELGWAPPSIVPSRDYFYTYKEPQHSFPLYSTQLSDAWEVTKELSLSSIIIHYNHPHIDPVTVLLVGGNKKGGFTVFGDGQTEAHAICLAALKAVE